MSCSKCTSVPEVPEGENQLFISAEHDYILEKFFGILTSEGIDAEYGHGQIFLKTECFSDFIKKIYPNKALTSMEKTKINILPLGENDTFNFSKVALAKNFDSWYTLANSGELAWILENESIVVHFQPIVDVNTLDIYGYECLARGVLEDGSFMNPGTMFSSAKKTGMLFNLDRQCRESAIRFASKNGIDKNIFINFLPSAIYNPEFCLRDTVKWASDLDFNPDNIIFEVVETEDVEDTEHLKQILQFYKDKGFRTALDDVGSGYASLSLFASLRPNIIKIDIDIVRDVHISDFKQAVAKALKIMADESGCKVLAEGIETKEEFDWFKNLGVDYAQGYYLAKPSPEPVSSISIK